MKHVGKALRLIIALTVLIAITVGCKEKKNPPDPHVNSVDTPTVEPVKPQDPPHPVASMKDALITVYDISTSKKTVANDEDFNVSITLWNQGTGPSGFITAHIRAFINDATSHMDVPAGETVFGKGLAANEKTTITAICRISTRAKGVFQLIPVLETRSPGRTVQGQLPQTEVTVH